MNSFSKIFAILFSVGVLFLAPILYFSVKQDQTNQTYVYDATVKFVDDIRKNGYVTRELYLRYLDSLSRTGNIYEIDIESMHETIIPLVDSEGNVQVGSYDIVEYNTYTDEIEDELFNKSGIYKFSKNDYISLKVYNINESFGGKMIRVFLRTEKMGKQIFIKYGGMIRDENY